MANPMVDICGARFGRLLVVSYAGKYGNSSGAAWKCLCDCGAEVVRGGTSLRLGQSISCGCLRVEKLVNRNKEGSRQVKAHPLYVSWRTMVRRCHDPSTRMFKTYGAAGISVCDRWRNDFHAFLADMGERPAGHTLDRIDSKGDYSPENCRWATAKQQNSNRSNVSLVNVAGELLAIPDACERLGLSLHTARGRIRRGWSASDAVLTPAGEERRHEPAER